MYYPDLSPYAYSSKIAGALNVGWLDPAQPYPRGSTPEGFAARLADFCAAAHRVNRTQRVHHCALCPTPTAIDDLGSAEIRVVGEGLVFAAPDLIGHYVQAHGYRPPQAFIRAVLDGPAPGSIAWWAGLDRAARDVALNGPRQMVLPKFS